MLEETRAVIPTSRPRRFNRPLGIDVFLDDSPDMLAKTRSVTAEPYDCTTAGEIRKSLAVRSVRLLPISTGGGVANEKSASGSPFVAGQFAGALQLEFKNPR